MYIPNASCVYISRVDKHVANKSNYTAVSFLINYFYTNYCSFI